MRVCQNGAPSFHNMLQDSKTMTYRSKKRGCAINFNYDTASLLLEKLLETTSLGKDV